MKNRYQKSAIALAVLSTLSLSACNIELTLDEETRETINKTSTGVINALGELEVNGVTYDTSKASVVLDGKDAEASDLRLGMVVSVTGTENDDGTGSALLIQYEDVTEGIVDSNNSDVDNTLNIMGQTVHVDDKTVFESNDDSILDLSDVNAGNIVEVSGHTSGDGVIWATRIEVKKYQYDGGDEIEVKGKITGLTETTFNLGELKIDYERATLPVDFDLTQANNLYVEVSSKQGFNEFNALIADKIEIKGNGDIHVKYASNDEEVELKGRITDVLSDTEIEINGAVVMLSNDTKFENGNSDNLVNGLIVEVEGYIDADGKFHATELEYERDDDRDNDRDDDRDNDRDDDRDDDRDNDRDNDRDDDRDDDRDND